VLLHAPRLTIAGLSGDAGKTLVAIGMARALTRRGLRVAAYKKGPDYIDAGWLGAAVRGEGRNLDTFLMRPEGISSGLAHAAGADLLLVEGNRGLFDGVDVRGSHSTAVLARRLASPVLLVVDVTKMTRTAAALVLGCRALDPELNLAGVILNRVGTPRQEKLVRRAIGDATDLPVVGALPRLGDEGPLPGRHLGLVTAVEHPDRERALEHAADVVEREVDLAVVRELARKAPEISLAEPSAAEAGEPVRVAVVADPAFSFYYPENLEALRDGGAELVRVAALADEAIPEVDAILIGGGFPEVHVERLAAASRFLASLRAHGAAGVPVYAECGGLMLLARQLAVGGRTYEMSGVLDLAVEQTETPQGHGYAEGQVDAENPFFATGTVLRGHEFHYSRVVAGTDVAGCCVGLTRGRGVDAGRDGVCHGNVWASYLHLHASSGPEWARGVLGAARRHARDAAAAPARR